MQRFRKLASMMGVEHAIILAPMAGGTSTPALVAAVALPPFEQQVETVLRSDVPMRTAAARKGSADCLSSWAGQAAPLAREMPAAELVAQLLRETAVVLESIAL